MASSILNRVGMAAARRLAEETFERGVREGLAAGENENLISRRILKAFFAPTSALATAIQAIPGVRYAPHISLTVAAEYLSEHADKLLPGDNRQIVKLVRHTLKTAAPVLEGVGDAAADVLEGKIDAAVDATVASPSRPGSKGLLDKVRVWLVDGRAHLVIPTLDAAGKVTLDTFGNPLPANFDMPQMARWLADEFTKSGTRRERTKDGKGIHEVPVPPKKRNLTDEIGLRAAIQLLGGPEGLNPEQLARLEELLKPVAIWESRISPDVDKVLSWLIDVLSFVALNLTALERQEVEDLVQKMKQRRSDPEWVNRRLGRFAREVEGFPLTTSRTYNSAALKRIRTLFSRIRDEIDITLEGEQSAFTKARKILQAAPDILRQVRETLATSAPWVMRGFWVWMAVLITGLLFLILGIVLPPGWVTIILAVSGGILGFAFTWAFPPIQSLFFWLPEGMRQDKDWLKGLGRRIAGFSLSLGCGILPLLIWLEFPSMVRVLLVATGVLAPMGYLFAYTEADREDLAKKRVLQSVTVSTWVFTVPAVVAVALVGLRHAYSQGAVYMNGPQTVKWAVDGIGAKVSAAGSWFGGLHWWHWAGGGAIVVFALILGTILFGGSKDGKGSGGSGSGDRAMTLASILIGIGAFVATLLVLGWLAQSCLREIGSWF